MQDSALIPSHVRWAGIFLIAGFFIFFVAAFSSGPIPLAAWALSSTWRASTPIARSGTGSTVASS